MNIDILLERIGYFRNKKNLSARELSLRIGKSDTYINQVESKNFRISLPVLFDIIEALEISFAEFFSDNFQNYRQDKEILDILKSLSPERKKSFLDLMKNTK